MDTLADIDIGVLLPRIQEGGSTSIGLEPDGTGKIMGATAPGYKAN